MEVTQRIVNVRRHTIGYVIGGREYTRLQAVKLAQRGAVDNVLPRSAPVPHIIGDGHSLYDLPSRIGRGPRFALALSR